MRRGEWAEGSIWSRKAISYFAGPTLPNCLDPFAHRPKIRMTSLAQDTRSFKGNLQSKHPRALWISVIEGCAGIGGCLAPVRSCSGNPRISAWSSYRASTTMVRSGSSSAKGLGAAGGLGRYHTTAVSPPSSVSVAVVNPSFLSILSQSCPNVLTNLRLRSGIL
jgi:hypothetical protein